MTESRPLLTVIVPTRERADTLAYTLRSILDNKSTKFNVVVSDNLSQDDTKEVVERIGDPRVRYYNTGRRLSMSDNWEFAMQYCDGEFITIIGDDDGILPGAIDRLEPFLQSGRAKVYTWPVPFYRWPMDGLPASATRVSGVQPPRARNIRKMARFAMRMGTWRHNQLPSLYHSAVHRSIVEGIRAQTGKVFQTTNPDIFNAFSVAAFTETALNVGFTVTVAGHSKKSNGGAMSHGGVDEARKSAERHFSEFGEYKFHPTLYPPVPMQVKLIPDSALVAKDVFPQAYGDVRFGYAEMWGWLYRMRWLFRWESSPMDLIRQRREVRKYHPLSTVEFLAFLLLQHSINWTRRVWQRPEAGTFEHDAPPNIVSFVQALAQLQQN